ncbi:helix-turn-helix transcriptional regulator [Mucilaginibacter sp.]
MNRIDRISAILIQLQSRRVVKASDISERFNISLRTVYRDVRTLEEAGIPLIGEAGVGYSIMDGYRLSPVMFTKEEATALLTAEKFVEQLADAATIANHKSAMYKIKAILRSAEKDLLEDIDPNIQVIINNQQPKQTANNYIQNILDSILQKNVLSIDYFAHHSQKDTKREIEPVGIFCMDTNWHLIAYCLLRKDYRNFRIDRIKCLNTTDKKFNKQHPTLKAYIAQTAKEKQLEMVIIKVEKKVYPMLSYQKYWSGFVSEKDLGDLIEMTFLTVSLEGFARWYIMFADSAEILHPESLKERIKTITQNILQKIDQPDFLLT